VTQPEKSKECTIGQEPKQARAPKFSEGLVDVEMVLETLNIRPGQTILDGGCGTGYMARAFSDRVTPSGRVYALDRDRTFVRLVAEETKGSNILALEGDLTRPSRIPGSSVDVVYASSVVWLLSRSQMLEFVEEVKRILKPGGRLAIVEMDKKETAFGPPLEQRYSPEELKARIPLPALSTVKVGEHFYMQVFVMNVQDRAI
jgi:ubiquinone/menaquinone biosynthesis C-methylase UbiE